MKTNRYRIFKYEVQITVTDGASVRIEKNSQSNEILKVSKGSLTLNIELKKTFNFFEILNSVEMLLYDKNTLTQQESIELHDGDKISVFLSQGTWSVLIT